MENGLRRRSKNIYEKIVNLITLGGGGLLLIMATVNLVTFAYFYTFGVKNIAYVDETSDGVYLVYAVQGEKYRHDITDAFFEPIDREEIWYLPAQPEIYFRYAEVEGVPYWYAGTGIVLIIRFLFLTLIRNTSFTAQKWYGVWFSAGREWTILSFKKDKKK